MKDYPKLYDRSGRLLGILENAKDVVISDQLITETNGQETLTFKLPRKDPKRQLLDNELLVRCGGSEFVIRVIEEGRQPDVAISCEATFYDLGEMEPIHSLSLSGVGPAIVLGEILKGTGWSVGTVEVTVPGDFSITEPTNPLAAIRRIPTVYGGELQFDNIHRKVNLLKQVGQDNGVLFAYGKNIDDVKRIADTRDLATRLYPYGANGLSISAVNNGLEYIENYRWYDTTGKPRQMKVATLKNEKIGNPSYLKYWAEQQLERMSWPKLTYEVSVKHFGDEPLNLGDIVTVYDRELDLNLKVRVAQRNYNVLEPWKTTVQLDSALYTLADQLTGAEGGTVANVSNAIQQAMQDLVMFNLLLNSRGDNGFAYWINNGWEIDNTAGVSGKAAFKAVGQMGVSKTLTQSVTPSTRQKYTISAQVEINDLQKGPSGRVGFNITIEYEDGSTENRFIAIG